jgi:hypothetical protein
LSKEWKTRKERSIEHFQGNVAERRFTVASDILFMGRVRAALGNQKRRNARYPTVP